MGEDENKMHDLVIIGAGPAGMAATTQSRLWMACSPTQRPCR